MAILALDTCLHSCSAAIVAQGTVLAKEAIPLQKGHAEALAPLVSRLLKTAKITIPDLSRIGVTIGPGSFTGVRVGLAFARGLAIGHTSPPPVIGITTLEALAHQHRSEKMKIVLIDARRGQVYGQLFPTSAPAASESMAKAIPPFIATYEDARSFLSPHTDPMGTTFIGSGFSCVYPDKPALAEDPIDAVELAILTARKSVPRTAPEALYIRAADAKPAKPILPQH